MTNSETHTDNHKIAIDGLFSGLTEIGTNKNPYLMEYGDRMTGRDEQIADDIHPVANDSFITNSTCILSENQIHTINQFFILYDYPDEASIRARPVLIKQVSIKGAVLYFRAIDMITKKNIVKHVALDNPGQECPWILISPDYILHNIRNKTPSQNIEQQSGDLLDFDF